MAYAFSDYRARAYAFVDAHGMLNRANIVTYIACVWIYILLGLLLERYVSVMRTWLGENFKRFSRN